MEIWKEIKDLDGYFVSNYGRVKGVSVKTKFGNQIKIYPERFLNPWRSRTGYNYIDISIDGKISRFLLHRLVAMYFIENTDSAPQINHIDGNKNNNHIDNLEWCSAADNLKHARRLGLNNSIGTNNKMAKFNENQVIDIRNSTDTVTNLAAKYNSPLSVISRIKSLKAYTNVK